MKQSILCSSNWDLGKEIAFHVLYMLFKMSAHMDLSGDMVNLYNCVSIMSDSGMITPLFVAMDK